MKPKVSVFVAMSLDGFIARSNGDIDWLETANEEAPEGEDYGYQALMSSVDMLVMGRKTYEKVLSFGEWPYGKTSVTVLSRSLKTLDEGVSKATVLSSEDPETLCHRLSESGYKHLYVDGGQTIQQFLACQLVDEMTLTIIPILLRTGIPLFHNSPEDLQLKLISSQGYPNSFVQLKYQVLA